MGHNEATSIKHFVAVHSAKGGVGKSTVTANLAVAMARAGMRVALFDADVHGPSMGLMMGDDSRPEPGPNDDFVYPLERHQVRFLSMANLVSAQTPLVWRGAMVHNMITQFLNGVLWGERDIMLIDMPPGTGDAQLSLSQAIPLSGAVVVTTPQELSLVDSVRGMNAFRKLNVPILGVIENMAEFICDSCGTSASLFGGDGGRMVAEEFELNWLGSIPIEGVLCMDSDAGTPSVSAHPDALSSRALTRVADQLMLALERSASAATFHLEWSDMGWDERLEDPPESAPEDGPVAAIWQVSADELGISWADGQKDVFGTRALRLACPCAMCVDEWSGQQRLDPESVDPGIRIKSLTSVGRYALAIDFSDGHNTGIYHFDRLKDLARPVGDRRNR